MIDTSKLEVGQEVCMTSGPYVQKGNVVSITRDGVEVQVRVGAWDTPYKVVYPDGAYQRIYFDNSGRLYACENFGPRMKDMWEGNGTYESGPWVLEN